MAKRKPNTAPMWRMIFVIYIGVMLWLLFGRSWGWDDGQSYEQMLKSRINLTPLHTIDNYLNVILHNPKSPYFQQCIIELAGNLLLFVPAGWLLPKVFKRMRRFFPFFFTCVGIVFLVETVQLFTLLGRFDIDDVILNTTGILIGFIGYTCFGKK